MSSRRTLLFLVAVVALLAVGCILFPEEGVTIGGKTCYLPSLHKVLVPKEQLDLEAFLSKETAARKAELNNLNDSLVYYRTTLDSSDIRFWFPDSNDAFFDPLFTQLDSAQATGRTIRILHYGDSQIEMDHITSRLRAYMQGHFGGGGPGLVPIHYIIPSLSVSIYASDMLLQSPFGGNTHNDSVPQTGPTIIRANGNYGPMTQSFRLAGSANSTIKATQRDACDDHLKRFSHFVLLFNNRQGAFTATLNDRRGYAQQLTTDNPGVGSLTWQLDSAATQVRFALNGNADLYGVMVDDGPGVAVDNIPMRGCSGQQFTQINQSQLAAAYSLMDIGLIIMQFGGNSAPYIRNEKALETYCTSLGKQIDRLHQCCPQVLILFIGPSDMSTTVRGEMQTYPFLPQMIDGLRQVANAHGAAYWSIYDAMGGQNSMPVWVNKGLAGADYVHFSQRGADIMGDRLAEAFNNMYELYRLRAKISQL